MSQRVKDVYPDISVFGRMLEDAASNATTPWANDFIADMEEGFNLYKGEMFLSDRQHELLERIANSD